MNNYHRTRRVLVAGTVALWSVASLVFPVAASAHNKEDDTAPGADSAAIQLYPRAEIGTAFSPPSAEPTSAEELPKEEIEEQNLPIIQSEKTRSLAKIAAVVVLSVIVAALVSLPAARHRFLRAFRQANALTGAMILSMFVLLFVTGVAMSFQYLPFPQLAYGSIEVVAGSAFFSFMRGVHYWATDIMLILMVVHLTRVVFKGVKDEKTRVAYWSGLALLVLMGASAVVGTFLRSDQEAYEAYAHFWIGTEQYLPPIVTVVTRYIGLGDTALMRFFVLHTIALPALIVLVIGLHAVFAKTFKGLLLQVSLGLQKFTSEKPAKKKRPIFPQLHLLAVSTGVLWAAAGVLAALFPAPLFTQAFNGLEITKPPWYLLWIYGFENQWGMSAILTAPTVALILLFVLPLFPPAGRWPRATKALYTALVIAVVWAALSAALGAEISHMTSKQP